MKTVRSLNINIKRIIHKLKIIHCFNHRFPLQGYIKRGRNVTQTQCMPDPLGKGVIKCRSIDQQGQGTRADGARTNQVM